MSISALYRTHTPFIGVYGYYDRGVWVEVQTEPVWIKSNVQPYKTGAAIQLTDAVVLEKDWKLIYTKELPDYGIPEEVDESGVTHYCYINGSWYKVQSYKDYSMAGRNPKHYVYTVVRDTSEPVKGWEAPTPLASLVTNFEEVVVQLSQLTNIIFEE